MDEALLLYDKGDFKASRMSFERMLSETDGLEQRNLIMFNISSCLFSEGDGKQAIGIIDELSANKTSRDDKQLLYNRALYLYKSHKFDEATEILDHLIEFGQQEFTAQSDSLEFASLRSDYHLGMFQNSCLIPAINLKAAALYWKCRNRVEAAQYLFETIPIKDQSDYDCVSLHNSAIYECGKDPLQSINKLLHLLDLKRNDDSIIIPNETYQNILALYLTISNQTSHTREFFREHKTQLDKHMSKWMIEYLTLQLEEKSADNNQSFNQLERQSKLFEKLMDSMNNSDQNRKQDMFTMTELIKTMADNMASVMWRHNQLRSLEKLLHKLKSTPLTEQSASYEETLRKNLGHLSYMTDTRFEECVQAYESLVSRSRQSSLISADPVVLANLCVAYVLTGRNSDAEQLIKDLELEENEFPDFDFTNTDELDDLSITSDQYNLSHLHHINLAIAILYCVKDNYSFGLNRMFKTMEPLKYKLTGTTWFHAKRCILALLNQYCKQTTSVADDMFDQIVEFLIQCETHGIHVNASPSPQQKLRTSDEHELTNLGRNSVTYEARYLRSLILSIIHE